MTATWLRYNEGTRPEVRSSADVVELVDTLS